MQRRDQIGLRLHDLRAVDLEQWVAALYVVADLGDQARHAARERRGDDRAGILVEGNLADRGLLDAELFGHDRYDAELMQLARADTHHVRIFGCALSARIHRGNALCAEMRSSKEKQGCHTHDRHDGAPLQHTLDLTRSHWTLLCPEAGTRFCQPPPSAWNSA